MWSLEHGGSLDDIVLAGVFGLIAAFATMFPNRTISLLVLFVIPVSLKAKTLLLIEGAIAVFGILYPGDNIAHAAHLGGAICAVAYLRIAWRSERGQL